MLFVGHFTHRRPRGRDDAAYFCRGHFDVRVARILCHDFAVIPRGTRDDSALARLQFDVVYECSHWHIPQRQSVGERYGSILGNKKCVTHFHLLRHETIALLPVGIYGKSDEAGAERVVLDGSDLRGDIFLIEFEIHLPIRLLVPTALMAHRDSAKLVPPAEAAATFHKGFLRLVPRKKLAVLNARVLTLGLRCWFVCFHTRLVQFRIIPAAVSTANTLQSDR